MILIMALPACIFTNNEEVVPFLTPLPRIAIVHFADLSHFVWGKIKISKCAGRGGARR